MVSTFIKVYEYSNWCYWDCFEGTKQPVKSGWYDIKWPDGSYTNNKVVTMQFNRQGGREDISYAEAWIEAWVRGKLVKFRATGLELKFVKPL